MLRATWIAQEILSTFAEEIGSVSLIPSESAGRYEIKINEVLIWDRKVEGGFPSPKELKQRIRDIISPNRNLGHIDRS